ncbi:MAG TPA: dihydroxy-acid dehydratase, partial [Spirochaetia bacterium]|nr:dihydroxy-acid dehydratase [Spirochaetia bacterium]
MISDRMKKGFTKAAHRSLLKATGLSHEMIEKRPIIGIANSYNDIIPGHIHLDKITKAVREGILMAGGTPLEFGVIGVCDGIAMNHIGMKYSLGSRECIADSIEIMAMAHAFDGIALVTNCDKITPGMMIAAARLNIPSIIVSGGPMLAGEYNNCGLGVDKLFEAGPAAQAGKISREELLAMENATCPGAGSCAGLYTANSMNCLSEALGLALPFNGTTPAVMADRIRLSRESGRQVVEMVRKNIRPRDILIREAFENAVAVDMAIGGSSNTALHIPAIAHYAGIDLRLKDLNVIAGRTPHLCHLAPAGNFHMQDLHKAGGIPAVMNELSRKKLLSEKPVTVLGSSIKNYYKNACRTNDEVIRPLENPRHADGGLAVLTGNLAPEGSIVKQA